MLIIDDAESLTDALDDIEIQKEKILTPPCSHPTSASTPCRHFVFLSVNNSQKPARSTDCVHARVVASAR